LECARILNVDGIYNIIVDMKEEDVKLLNKIKPIGKGIVSKYLEYSDNILMS